jgi:hypothetical protein
MDSFNEANVDNRLRLYVRGRVIVFTTSRIVEYLTENEKESYPLYSQDYYQPGYGLSFMVELEGYLTFDADSFVKMRELSSFTAPYYEPTNWAVVKAADPYVSVVTGLYIEYPNPDGSAYTVLVSYSTQDGNGRNAEMQADRGLTSEQDWRKTFSTGSVWKGPSGYKGYHPANI